MRMRVQAAAKKSSANRERQGSGDRKTGKIGVSCPQGQAAGMSSGTEPL